MQASPDNDIEKQLDEILWQYKNFFRGMPPNFKAALTQLLKETMLELIGEDELKHLATAKGQTKDMRRANRDALRAELRKKVAEL